jgi:hypothetical protein
MLSYSYHTINAHSQKECPICLKQTSKLIVYLLEINDHIGHTFIDHKNKYVIKFKKKMANWIYQKVIVELFYSKK